MRSLRLLALAAVCAAPIVPLGAHAAPLPAGTKPGLTVDDMLAMQRISEHEVSPDGQWVVFTVRDTDVDANRGRTDLWIAKVDGSVVRRLTTHPENDGSARFSPDGRSVYFLSTRTGSSQLWRISIDGGEAVQVTKLPVDVGGFRLFPDGKRFLLALEVYPDVAKLEDTVARDEERAKSKVKARAYESLLFRHWDTWEDGKRSHLFTWSVDQGAPVDLMRGQDVDAPTAPFGGMEETSISPDGKWVAYTAKDEGRSAAWSTNADVFLVPADGKEKATRVTAENAAWDGQPSFSPDGKTLAYLSMTHPQYESDRQRVVLFDVASKKKRVLTEGWDRSATGVEWSADGKTIYTSADHLGNHGIFAIDVASAGVRPLLTEGSNHGPTVAGDRIVFARDRLNAPAELYSMKADASDLKPITKLNAERVAKIAWGDYEQFSFTGAHGDKVFGYAVKPANYKGGKVPGVMIIHGGPQGSMGDHWHYRWNPQAFAGHGFGVVFIDFHGSTGYGQKFTDAIRGDWGGAPFEDLMKGLDFALDKYTWLDKDKMMAAGASYGGFMINWINGKTDRFKALVCHDGNLDERFAYFDTEELWFPEWEHGGLPWEQPEGYLKHNPIDGVKSWKTPTLVVHGSLDYRVTENHGMSTFTALQRKGVPSRLVIFPDENHWVLKPQNSKRWHEEVLGWLDRWSKKS